MKKTIITTVFCILALSLNAQIWGSKRIKGNGNSTTIKRTILNFDEINISGSFDVILKNGKTSEISIEGEENIIPLIETEVSRNKLKIRYKNNTNIGTTKKVTVTVYIQKIEEVSLGGSGNISADDVIKANELSINLGGSGNITLNIEANEIESKIGGSGNINLSGKTTEFEASVAGSGSINAYDLEVNKAELNIAGSGSIKLTVKKEMETKIVGSGKVYYKGNPSKVTTKTTGSGSVVNKN